MCWKEQKEKLTVKEIFWKDCMEPAQRLTTGEKLQKEIELLKLIFYLSYC